MAHGVYLAQTPQTNSSPFSKCILLCWWHTKAIST